MRNCLTALIAMACAAPAAAVTITNVAVTTEVRGRLGSSPLTQVLDTDADASARRLESDARLQLVETANGYTNRIDVSLAGIANFTSYYAEFRFRKTPSVDIDDPALGVSRTEVQGSGRADVALDGTTRVKFNYYDGLSFASTNVTYARTNPFAELRDLDDTLLDTIDLSGCRRGCSRDLRRDAVRIAIHDSMLVFNVGAPGGYAFPHTNYIVANFAAVPEPASWALLIAGFAGTGLALRRTRAVSRTASGPSAGRTGR